MVANTLREQKCKEYGCQYIERTEEFTTQSCSKCGYIKKDIGSNKIYTCWEKIQAVLVHCLHFF